MKEAEYYYTVEKAAIAEFKDRGSKFIAYSFPIRNTTDFKKNLQEIKKEHPKASHHCFAYRLGTDGNNFRVSDDGEPSGTAGKPILGQIDSKKLTDILIVVVRYFGGTLLGVPGLINAYKTSAALVLQCTHVVQKAVQINYELQFNYTEMNEVMRILKQFNCTILKNEMQLFCSIETGIPRNKINEVISALKEVKNLELHFNK
ncbi:YigZ family protein [Hanamia caeni]|uniref:YigZ family protein n=2 Tax=Hanamia caeni TaxID=2294116 RepID=A0A3M9NI44_9BACT|nr:YigZ family protein [Hanamia caeni]